MPILKDDLKFFKSDTMTDADEGGGSVTGNIIISGESNNIFDPISSLDEVYGAANMRKVFAAVFTQTIEKYYGSMIILSKIPKNISVAINLFDTRNWFDRRISAQNRVENYLALGGVQGGTLLGTQYTGSKVVTIYQMISLSIPDIGDVLVLKDSLHEQYVRIVQLDEEVREFISQSGQTFSRRVLTIQISDILENDFLGDEVNEVPDPVADVYDSVVANAARYYSTRPLGVAANSGDLSLFVDTIYSQIVPSAQSENPIIDATAGGFSAAIIESKTSDVSFIESTTFSANSRFFLGSACKPNSLSIQVSGDILTDDGGQLKNGASVIVASINYHEGVVVFGSDSPSYSGSKTITFRPAVAPSRLADTASLVVTADNRGYVWVKNINPAPAPSSVSVSFRALGKWYTLSDNGSGGLIASDNSIGSGSVNYITGSVSITLGALPDANSEIIFSWSNKTAYVDRGDLVIEPIKLSHTLANLAAESSTVTVTWNDGAARTATADANGDFSGDASGKIIAGKIELIPNVLPAKNTQFNINYSAGTLIELVDSTNFTMSSLTVTFDLGQTNIIAGSVTISWDAVFSVPLQPEGVIPKNAPQLIKDDSIGNLINLADGQIIGTINYVTGIAVFDNSQITYTHNQRIFESQSGIVPVEG